MNVLRRWHLPVPHLITLKILLPAHHDRLSQMPEGNAIFVTVKATGMNERSVEPREETLRCVQLSAVASEATHCVGPLEGYGEPCNPGENPRPFSIVAER